MSSTATKVLKKADENEVTPTLGQLFKKQRLHQKKTLEDVSEQLKIRRVFLQAIEDEQFDQLPGGVYTVGFIRSYAQYLGLDHDAIMEQLRDESFFLPVPLTIIGDEQHFPASRFVSNGMIVAGLFLLLIAAIVSYIFLSDNEVPVHVNWSSNVSSDNEKVDL